MTIKSDAIIADFCVKNRLFFLLLILETAVHLHILLFI